MRRAAKKDANQREIENALVAVGATYFDTSALGNGFPDLVVMHRKKIYLIEVKDGNKPLSAQRLTEAEARFHAQFQGCVYVVNSISQLFNVLNL